MSTTNRWAVGIFVGEEKEVFVSLTVGDAEMRMPAEAAWMIADALNTCAQYVSPGEREEAPDA